MRCFLIIEKNIYPIKSSIFGISSSGISNSIGLQTGNIPISNIGYSQESRDKEGIARNTVIGNVEIGTSTGAAINRDLSKANEVTRDVSKTTNINVESQTIEYAVNPGKLKEDIGKARQITSRKVELMINIAQSGAKIKKEKDMIRDLFLRDGNYKFDKLPNGISIDEYCKRGISLYNDSRHRISIEELKIMKDRRYRYIINGLDTDVYLKPFTLERK